MNADARRLVTDAAQLLGVSPFALDADGTSALHFPHDVDIELRVDEYAEAIDALAVIGSPPEHAAAGAFIGSLLVNPMLAEAGQPHVAWEPHSRNLLLCRGFAASRLTPRQLADQLHALATRCDAYREHWLRPAVPVAVAKEMT
ncbi:type III secretion system chaperone [Ramlibacter sp. AW1]|uniref:Type III secretion system chaperone n=1 Tax=Ramlibacter aurantiacus TaxID=2801330 RepID=A0A936ZPW0_9BURK|nr:type III secretion system chaperone [Ramlibacter aurantiacus]MBL0418815.1 type III secretion system chaperone [Ramlibacter aurantiacus]